LSPKARRKASTVQRRVVVLVRVLCGPSRRGDNGKAKGPHSYSLAWGTAGLFAAASCVAPSCWRAAVSLSRFLQLRNTVVSSLSRGRSEARYRDVLDLDMDLST
jgi:hypothetical protein